MKLFAFKCKKVLTFGLGSVIIGTVKKRQSEYTYEKGLFPWLYIRGVSTKEPDRSKDLSGSFTFPCYPRTNFPVANSRGCAATRRGDYAQLFCCDWKFSSTRPMFSQIAMFSTAETGSIGSGSDRDDHVSRRKGRWPCVLPRGLQNLEAFP